MLTFWLPTPLLAYVGRMKCTDVRQAWREKVALNLLIWFICASAVFIIAVLGVVICPTEHVFSTSELASHSSIHSPNNVNTSVRGEVFDLTTVAATHQRVVGVVPTKAILKYSGQSTDNIFPVQVRFPFDFFILVLTLVYIGQRFVRWYIRFCQPICRSNNTDPNSVYHDFRAFTNDSRPDRYFESMVVMRYTARVGFLGYTPKEVRNMASAGRSAAIYNGLVYDITNYLTSPPAVRSPAGKQAPSTDTNFTSRDVLNLFQVNAGMDITKRLNLLNIDSDVLARQKVCLCNLFSIGKVDNRQSPQCLFATYILLVLSVIMVSIIGFKFLASINFSSACAPENHNKFVICQVPCYTEGDTSLRKTIDSLAQMKYDDKRKLLLVICNGMIVGSGNDRPTLLIVLDILWADPNLDPEPLSFMSLGEGAKQHNMCKVYSGLYECAGHVVPYLVVVRAGKLTERSCPGNRGKRDSNASHALLEQCSWFHSCCWLLSLTMIDQVHFNSPMTPLALEMYHQINNVIGVNPSFYEYFLMVDTDTTVDLLSVNRLISVYVRFLC